MLRPALLALVTALGAYSAYGAPLPGSYKPVPLEEKVKRDCGEYELVFVADVVGMRDEQRNGEAWETAALSVTSALKGSRERIPSTRSGPKLIPDRTDQRSDFLHKGMTYLMFLRPAPSGGWEGPVIEKYSYEVLGDPRSPGHRRPMERTDTFFQSALSFARKYCER